MITALLRALGWIPVSEVVRRDSFETELSAITPDAAVREEVRQVALMAAKVGMVSADEFARLIQLGMSLTIVRVRDLEWAKGKNPSEIDERIASITASVDDFEQRAINHANGNRDAFANCDDCGSWPTHAPACPRRQDHTDVSTP